MDDLSKCGCGGEAEVRTNVSHNGIETYFVICPKCGMRSWRNRDRAKAIEIWNRAMGAEKTCLKCIHFIHWGLPFCSYFKAYVRSFQPEKFYCSAFKTEMKYE